MPKKVHCSGSGDLVDGPDENDGTVFCKVCGTSFLPIKTVIKNGRKELHVSDHNRILPPKVKISLPSSRRDRSR